MKRFITYLFEYENGRKGKNIGFIRIDIRNGTCRMEVHVHNLNRFQGKGQIFLLADQGELVGIPVGDMVISQGRGDAKKVFPANPAAGTEYPFTAIVGVGIRFGNQYYAASSWMDENREELGLGKFRVWEKDAGRKEPAPEPSAAEESLRAGGASQPRQPGTSASPEANLPGEPEGMEQERSQSEREKVQPPQIHQPSPEQPQTDTSTPEPMMQPREQPQTELSGPQPAQSEIARQQEETLQKFDMQQPRQPKTTCGEPVINISRMDISGIRQLPKRNWYLCNNSFVIHGYFNYHYLILKEVKENGVCKHYLGVPGIYEKPERVMAMLFGFPEFEPETDLHKGSRQPSGEDKEPGEEGVFGYWFCLLDT